MGTAGFICVYVAAWLACMTAGLWLAAGVRARMRRRLARPPEPEPVEADTGFTAWTATTVLTVRGLADDGFGEIAFGPARITLDEAADLASTWTGGPYVVIAPAGIGWLADGRLVTAWGLHVMAFIAEEVAPALYEVREMIEDGRWKPEPGAYALRGGEVFPLERLLPG